MRTPTREVREKNGSTESRKKFKPSVAYDPLDVHIGQNLRVLRKQQRMALEDLSRQLGVSYQQIQKYETGHNRISASTLHRMAKILGCAIEGFFTGLDGKQADREVPPYRDDIEAAQALHRIEDPAVRDTLRGLIVVLEDTPTAGRSLKGKEARSSRRRNGLA